MSRSSAYALYLSIFVVSIVGMIELAVDPDVIQHRAIKVVHISSLNYDGREAGPRFSEFSENADGPVKQFEISMTMDTYVSRSFSNLFQTAPLNSGLRLELAPLGTLALIAGDDNAAGYKVYIVAPSLTTGQLHSLDISVAPDDSVTTTLDGLSSKFPREPSLNYKISDIVVGTGFSKTRPFTGMIRDASISYGFYRVAPDAYAPLLSLLKIALFIIALAAVWLLSRFENNRSVSST